MASKKKDTKLTRSVSASDIAEAIKYQELQLELTSSRNSKARGNGSDFGTAVNKWFKAAKQASNDHAINLNKSLSSKKSKK